MPPGRAAAVASLEYQERNSRSMNHMIDQKQVWTIKGRATARTSRPPQGRDHQLVASFVPLAASPGAKPGLSTFSTASVDTLASSLSKFPILAPIRDTN